MRLIQYINEWKVVNDYAGRSIMMTNKGGVIIWYYMIDPVSKGLIWTKPNGDTFLNNKKIGIINYPNEKVTHKRQLADFYTELGFGKFMSGDLRDNVESLCEMNIRGRIIRDKIYVYRYEQQGGIGEKRKYDKLADRAVNAIYKYIPEEDIHEGFFGSADFRKSNRFGFGGYTEVFKNPSKSEMIKLGKQIRFSADLKNKVFYVFKLWAFHSDVWEKIIVKETNDKRKYNNTTLLFGVAEIENGEWRMGSSDECDPDDYDYEKIKWIEEYIDIKSWMVGWG